MVRIMSFIDDTVSTYWVIIAYFPYFGIYLRFCKTENLILETTFTHFDGQCRDANKDWGNWMSRGSVTSIDCEVLCSDLAECQAYQLQPGTTNCVLHCPTCENSTATSDGFTLNTGTSTGPIVQGNGQAGFDCYIKPGSTVFPNVKIRLWNI